MVACLDLKCVCLENVKGVLIAWGGEDAFYNKVIFILRKLVPEFNWCIDANLFDDASNPLFPMFLAALVQATYPLCNPRGHEARLCAKEVVWHVVLIPLWAQIHPGLETYRLWCPTDADTCSSSGPP